MILQGDVFWIDLGDSFGSEPGYYHPYVVIQSDQFNLSRLRTTVVCGVTSNLKRATVPGNVLLEDGEGGLPKRSVVNVSQLYTVDKGGLVEKIGALSSRRVRQILEGIQLVLAPSDQDLLPGE